jgi:hypothetical protein
VTRIWTSHEQALAACFGEDNTGSTACFVTPPSPVHWRLKVIDDAKLLLPDDLPFVTLRTPIQWTIQPGLSGPGIHKPRRYKPPYLRLTNPGIRPKPQPAYKTPAGPQRTAQKRVTFKVDAIEKPPTKQQRAASNVPDGMGNSQSLVGVQRSARMQSLKAPTLYTCRCLPLSAIIDCMYVFLGL